MVNILNFLQQFCTDLSYKICITLPEEYFGQSYAIMLCITLFDIYVLCSADLMQFRYFSLCVSQYIYVFTLFIYLFYLLGSSVLIYTKNVYIIHRYTNIYNIHIFIYPHRRTFIFWPHSSRTVRQLIIGMQIQGSCLVVKPMRCNNVF